MPDGSTPRYSFPIFPTGVPEETLRIINQGIGVDSGPDQRSMDSNAMLPYWDMVETYLAGPAAVRRAGEKYLPRYVNEGVSEYEFRRVNAKFTNIFGDIVESLAAKPFSKECNLVEDKSSEALQELVEDIDGKGNHLHVFASQVFFRGIADAISWIMVDKTKVPEGATIADEEKLGARPYWVRIDARNVLDVRSAMIEGREEIIHFRVYEPKKVYVGFKEKLVNRIRMYQRDARPDGSYGPPLWFLYEETDPDPQTHRKSWIIIETGGMGVMDVIPIVPFITGRRKHGWCFDPPMNNAAELQKEHYQQETNLKSAKEATAFPMLSGNGIDPPMDKAGNIIPIGVGPKSILYAPPRSTGDGGVTTGSWSYVEIAATSLKFLSDEVDKTEKQLRELGRQPLTAQSGNITVITSAFAAVKSNSAVQSWALGLKDALELAFKYTAKWLGDPSEPEVYVFVDFSPNLNEPQAASSLLTMRKERDISRKALIIEAKRRDWLSPEYNTDEDAKEIALEGPAPADETDLENALDDKTKKPAEEDV